MLRKKNNTAVDKFPQTNTVKTLPECLYLPK